MHSALRILQVLATCTMQREWLIVGVAAGHSAAAPQPATEANGKSSVRQQEQRAAARAARGTKSALANVDSEPIAMQH
jgi:hypothetical protein